MQSNMLMCSYCKETEAPTWDFPIGRHRYLLICWVCAEFDKKYTCANTSKVAKFYKNNRASDPQWYLIPLLKIAGELSSDPFS